MDVIVWSFDGLKTPITLFKAITMFSETDIIL